MSFWIFAIIPAFVVVWLCFRGGPNHPNAKLIALQEYRFPQVVLDVFTKENPHRTPEQRQLAFQGLKEYFILMLLAQQAGRKATLGMTSVLIDDAWHAFVLCTKQYEEFCLKVFGKMIHHSPNPASRPGAVDANTTFTPDVMNTWAAYRYAKTQYPDSFRSVNDTPLLFGLDSYVGLNDGWVWSTDALRSLEDQSRRNAEAASEARRKEGDSNSSCSSCAAFMSVAELNGASESSRATEASSSSHSSHSHSSSSSSSSHHSSHSSSCSSSSSSHSSSHSSHSSCSSHSSHSSCSSHSCSSSSCSSSSCSSCGGGGD
jgi:hypothetical protein